MHRKQIKNKSYILTFNKGMYQKKDTDYHGEVWKQDLKKKAKKQIYK